MTKYILHGGYPAKLHDRGSAFFAELIRDHSEPKVIECLFARPERDWEEAFAKDNIFVDQRFAEQKVDFRLARFETFLEQLRWADVVYFRGGETTLLVECMRKMEGWKDLLDGTTVAGSSAGAHMLAKYYYGLHSLKVGEGLGLVAAKVIAHYKSDFNAPNIDWDKAYEKLKVHREDLPILTLAEGQFETRTV